MTKKLYAIPLGILVAGGIAVAAVFASASNSSATSALTTSVLTAPVTVDGIGATLQPASQDDLKLASATADKAYRQCTLTQAKGGADCPSSVPDVMQLVRFSAPITGSKPVNVLSWVMSWNKQDCANQGGDAALKKLYDGICVYTVVVDAQTGALVDSYAQGTPTPEALKSYYAEESASPGNHIPAQPTDSLPPVAADHSGPATYPTVVPSVGANGK